jgi:hypothetical protein
MLCLKVGAWDDLMEEMHADNEASEELTRQIKEYENKLQVSNECEIRELVPWL